MVKHVVMWNIQDEYDKEEVFAKLKDLLEGLVNKIDVLKKAEVGRNFNNKPSGHDVILYTEFDSKEDLESYLVHPAHVEAGKYVRSVVKDRADVDYII